ncbi:hypothetical protein OV079_23995 [Nannocystis pusilla]|uniref:Lipoprotein n=1 Tax=Nannocystis pusilla TaxID=889268 RepID=A0A9X3ERL0_9BACT|nr:hypothetical protein [Nannocystis pusilla]MCY1008566.1 hypothetical protein [Nannocystis pusilla]
MKSSKFLDSLCMATFITLSGCDVEVDGVVREFAEDAEPAPEDAHVALAGDAEDDGEFSADESLELSDSPDPAAVWECYDIQIQFRKEPSGLCGGCLIPGGYPGQKVLEYARGCENNEWQPWYVINSTCEDC